MLICRELRKVVISMPRIKGSGEQNIQTIGVRTNPKVINKIKLLAEVNGTSYSKEVRAALNEYLEKNREVVEEASRRIKKNVVVNADLGHLNKNVQASFEKSLGVETE